MWFACQESSPPRSGKIPPHCLLVYLYYYIRYKDMLYLEECGKDEIQNQSLFRVFYFSLSLSLFPSESLSLSFLSHSSRIPLFPLHDRDALVHINERLHIPKRIIFLAMEWRTRSLQRRIDLGIFEDDHLFPKTARSSFQAKTIGNSSLALLLSRPGLKRNIYFSHHPSSYVPTCLTSTNACDSPWLFSCVISWTVWLRWATAFVHASESFKQEKKETETETERGEGWKAWQAGWRLKH